MPMKLKTREFTKEQLQAIVWGEEEGFEVVDKEIVDISRWSNHYRMIFKADDGLYYESHYSEGVQTEQQCEDPYEYASGSDLECVQVELREVVRTEWVHVEGPSSD